MNHKFGDGFNEDVNRGNKCHDETSKGCKHSKCDAAGKYVGRQKEQIKSVLQELNLKQHRLYTDRGV